jgi:DNA helicase HerA-like ATPase
MMETEPRARLVGHVAWDGSTATSERVLLRAAVANRHLVERNLYLRIQDEEGERSGFLARVAAGPFFHRSGTPTVGGTTGSGTLACFLLADLEIQGEIVGGRPRDTQSRPAPGAPVFALSTAEVANLHGFAGDMLLGSLSGQDDQTVFLKSKDKGVLPRNLGVFGTVGSGKSNTTQVIIEEASRNGWAVIVVDVEGEYTEMDQPADNTALEERLARFGRRPEGLGDFQVLFPASCASDRAGAEAFTLRLADFETSVLGEVLQVSLQERNALLDCIEHLQQRSRTKVATGEAEAFTTLLDASPQAKLPFTLRSLRERAAERSSRSTESFDFAGLAAKLSWLVHAEAFDLVNMRSLDAAGLMVPGRVSVIDVSVANDVIKNLVTADLLRKTFALKLTRTDTPPTLLVIEEAHSFISRERAEAMQATLNMLRNVARRGRKRWLALAFVSQQPGHLPPELFELCNTRIVHTLRSTHNLEALMATTGDVGRELWAKCPLLGPGQAVLSSPQLHRSVVLSVRPAACRRRFTH